MNGNLKMARRAKTINLWQKKIWQQILNLTHERSCGIGLYHPLHGFTNPKYKLLCFFTKKIGKKKKAIAFNWDRCYHRYQKSPK